MQEVAHAKNKNRPIPMQIMYMTSIVTIVMRFVYNTLLSVYKRTYIVRLRTVSLTDTSPRHGGLVQSPSYPRTIPQQSDITWMKKQVSRRSTTCRVFLLIVAV